MYRQVARNGSTVPITKVAGTKLTLRAGGKDTPLKTEQVGNYLAAATPGEGVRVVFGHTDYGVVQKGEGKPFRLHYHPKAVIGDPFSKDATVGKEAAIEVVPVRDGSKVKFLVTVGGKPLPEAEVFLRKPGSEKSETVKTDATGHTPACTETGRYAVVARKLDAVAGEHGGKKYEEERHYATLVVDVPEVFLCETNVADAGMKELAKLTNLTWLNLAETHVADAGTGILPTLSAASPRFRRALCGPSSGRGSTTRSETLL